MKRKNPGMTFLRGFLYMFGIGDNPILEILKERRKQTDSERMSEDWVNVGKYIKTAYEQEISATRP